MKNNNNNGGIRFHMAGKNVNENNNKRRAAGGSTWAARAGHGAKKRRTGWNTRTKKWTRWWERSGWLDKGPVGWTWIERTMQLWNRRAAAERARACFPRFCSAPPSLSFFFLSLFYPHKHTDARFKFTFFFFFLNQHANPSLYLQYVSPRWFEMHEAPFLHGFGEQETKPEIEKEKRN